MEVVFQLKHNGLIGRKAIAQLPTTLYEMEHANFWGSRYNIIKDGSHIGAVSRNWSGERLIHLKDKDHQPIQFKLKQQSFFNSPKTHYRIKVYEIAYAPFPINELMAIIAYILWNKGF